MLFYEAKAIPFNEAFQSYIDESTTAMRQLVLEAYFGRTPEVQGILTAIQNARKDMYVSAARFNVSKEREEIENALCRAFGFECCQFSIDPSSFLNAYTIPVSNVVFDFRDFKRYIMSNGAGIKYTPDAHLYLIIVVTSGIFFNMNFTDEEITALILHEVGHNFQNAISRKYKPLNLIKKMMDITLFPILWTVRPSTSPFRNLFADLIRGIRRDASGLSVAYWEVVGVFKGLLEIGVNGIKILTNISAMLNPFAAWSNVPSQFLSGLLSRSTLFLPMSYRNEAIADEFANAYGFGAELSSALNKMEHDAGGIVADQLIKNSIFGNYFDLVMTPQKIVATMFDAHPENIARINNQVENNRKALESISTNPKMKKELNKQITDTEAVINDISKHSKQGYKVSDRIAINSLIAFGGDLRNVFARDIDKDFDAAEELAKQQYINFKQR